MVVVQGDQVVGQGGNHTVQKQVAEGAHQTLEVAVDRQTPEVVDRKGQVVVCMPFFWVWLETERGWGGDI